MRQAGVKKKLMVFSSPPFVNFSHPVIFCVSKNKVFLRKVVCTRGKLWKIALLPISKLVASINGVNTLGQNDYTSFPCFYCVGGSLLTLLCGAGERKYKNSANFATLTGSFDIICNGNNRCLLLARVIFVTDWGIFSRRFQRPNAPTQNVCVIDYHRRVWRLEILHLFPNWNLGTNLATQPLDEDTFETSSYKKFSPFLFEV